MNGAMTHFCAKKVEGIANHKCRYYNGDRDTNNSICHNVTFIFWLQKYAMLQAPQVFLQSFYLYLLSSKPIAK